MLEIRSLQKTFNAGTEFENRVFENLNLTFEKNRATAIIGSNGCGKSTLMNLIAGSLRPDSGEILLDGKNIAGLREEARSRYFGRVYQNPSLGVAPSLTILENMALADKKGERFGLRPLLRKERKERYIELLKTLDLGLEKQLQTRVKFLSGGQRQSLSLLMASMKHPKLLLLDEHTAALDPKTSQVVMEKTKALIENADMTTIMITHNMRDAIEFSDRVIMFDRGDIVLDRPSEELKEDELHAIYQKKLLDAQMAS